MQWLKTLAGPAGVTCGEGTMLDQATNTCKPNCPECPECDRPKGEVTCGPGTKLLEKTDHEGELQRRCVVQFQDEPMELKVQARSTSEEHEALDIDFLETIGEETFKGFPPNIRLVATVDPTICGPGTYADDDGRCQIRFGDPVRMETANPLEDFRYEADYKKEVESGKAIPSSVFCESKMKIKGEYVKETKWGGFQETADTDFFVADVKRALRDNDGVIPKTFVGATNCRSYFSNYKNACRKDWAKRRNDLVIGQKK